VRARGRMGGPCQVMAAFSCARQGVWSVGRQQSTNFIYRIVLGGRG
jgi:hypothetical protein